MGSENAFQYSTCLSSEQEPCIRLLELHGRKSEKARIDVTLKDYRFDDSLPEYDALSYAWGEDTNQKTIWCNDKPFKIGPNLFYALWWFTHPKHYEKRLFWIDRLCSNQDDKEEKSHQVSLMRHIFGRAKITTVWLGGLAQYPDSDIAKTMQHLEVYARIIFAEIIERHPSIDTTSGSSKRPTEARDAAPYTLIPVINLLNKTWFRRVWVMQEVAVSRKVFVQCNSTKIDFDVLALSVWLLGKQATEGPAASLDMANAGTLVAHTELILMIELRHGVSGGQHLELPNLLAATHRAGASLLEDKLYSLYGITTTDLRVLGLHSDYTVPTREAMIGATYGLLKMQGNLDILELAESNVARGNDMPSWVSAPRGPAVYGQSFLGHSKESQKSLFDAGGRIIYHENKSQWGSLSEQDLEKVLRDFRKKHAEFRFSDMHMPTLPKTKIISLELDAQGMIHLHGQIIDTIETIQPTIFKSRNMFSQQLEKNSPDSLAAPNPMTIRDFARVLIDRDSMVMGRQQTHTYPNGDKITTAYRKTVSTGQEFLSEEHAETVFNRLRMSLLGAKVTTAVERAFRFDVTFGIATMCALFWGSQIVWSAATSRMFQLMTESTFSRVLAWTKKGYLALVPAATKVGDSIALLKGGRLPFVLRSHENQDASWRLLGPSFIHGIMNGELSDDKLVELIRIA